MNIQLQNKLTKAFPWMDCFVECGDGWDGLIWNMCREIDDAYFEKGHKVDDIEIVQIKEKFGAMRCSYIYTDYTHPDIVSDIIGKYVELSKSTCEICGAEGKLLRDEYWTTVRCEDCRI